jgi:hypothetical protein
MLHTKYLYFDEMGGGVEKCAGGEETLVLSVSLFLFPTNFKQNTY